VCARDEPACKAYKAFNDAFE